MKIKMWLNFIKVPLSKMQEKEMSWFSKLDHGIERGKTEDQVPWHSSGWYYFTGVPLR